MGIRSRVAGPAAGLLLAALAACAPGAPPGPPNAGGERAATSAPASGSAASPASAPAPAATAPAPAARPAGTTALAPAQRFRWAGQSPATDAGLFVAIERGYFAEQGVDLDYQDFASASDMVPALATRQMDGGGIAVNAATINAVARGIELKAVADKGSMPPGFGWQAFLIRKDLADAGRVRSPADLRGMVFGTTPPINASAGYPALDEVLRRGGLTQDDIRIEAMGFPDVNAALGGRSIDFGIQIEPLVQAAVDRGLAVRWLGLDEVRPNQQIAVVGYGPSITVDNQALGHAFMVAYLKGVRDYNRAFSTGAGKAEVIAAIAKHSTVKDPATVEAIAPVGLRPDGRVNVESLIEDQQFYVEKGSVPTPIDMHRIVDNSYVEAALQAIGS
jgi:NitT/TauT family transport system substrate-binding protein